VIAMINFRGKGILLDIEGTTSSISFVYDVLFPYARRELRGFLASRWDEKDVALARELTARDAGFDSFEHWRFIKLPQSESPIEFLCGELLGFMDADTKSTGLKAMQGLIWKEGFARGDFRAHVFPDVPPALDTWNRAGMDIRIYSSGSVAAQKVFFAHSECGNLSQYLKGYFDTTSGPKREPQSYSKIASLFRLPAGEVLFLSDIAAELDAAATAGMRTALVARPGNAEVFAPRYPIINDFSEITVF